MKHFWLLFLISPVFFSGCVLLPNMEPQKQTVQKGSPPQVNPNMPGGKQTVTPQKWESNGNGTVQKPFPAANPNYTPITPEQVNEKNAYHIVEKMQDEIGGNGSKTGTPAMNYNHSTKDVWPK